ncbi:prepilin-type N-terminal cleavage/methylation domain-containing protein/prepilin-type processing-associated H-X9-DG domain-containing protein [Candidatus Fervidibacteria bacterium JGI MDM2 JNZ-1-D12]
MVGMRKTVKVGFTLIELLVVIAIIAILAAILFPVFSRARETAKRAQCLVHCRDIGLAIVQYAQDYDEILVDYQYSYPTGTSQGYTAMTHWMVVINPYHRNYQIFLCPAADTDGPIQWCHDPGTGCSANPDRPPTGRFRCRIGMNASIYTAAGQRWNAPNGKPLAVIQKPAETYFVMDAECNRATPADHPNWTSIGWGDVHRRHGDYLNIVFCDGHAKAISLQVVTSHINGNLGPWTYDDSEYYW